MFIVPSLSPVVVPSHLEIWLNTSSTVQWLTAGDLQIIKIKGGIRHKKKI